MPLVCDYSDSSSLFVQDSVKGKSLMYNTASFSEDHLHDKRRYIKPSEFLKMEFNFPQF